MRAARLATLLAAFACAPGAPAPATLRSLEGRLAVPHDAAGDGWIFLSRADAPPLSLPDYVSAVPARRLAEGDLRFVFGAVESGTYRAAALLDVDRSFDPRIDVLAQPTAGDRLAGVVEVEVTDRESTSLMLALDQRVALDPPGFRLSGGAGRALLDLPDQPAVVRLEVEAFDPAGVPAAFFVQLVDADGDGDPDDLDRDGVPDLSPRWALRFLPRPGQAVPRDAQGAPHTVVLPVVILPGPWLPNLVAAPSRHVAVEKLSLLVVPQARDLTQAELAAGSAGQPLVAIPVGEYELVAVAGEQFWRLPNDLGHSLSHQAVRFRVVHGSTFEGQ